MSLTNNALLAAALDYDARGWRVIPLHRVGPDGLTCSCNQGRRCGRNAGKHPKTFEWQKTPRMSAADIHATWGVDKAPNLGLAVGKLSGFWVLDIDPKNGGMETMGDLVAQHGRLPDTFVVQTGSGGLHYYFLLPDFELRNSTDRVGKGIDTRADGGQVVAAPSRSGVGDYVVIQDLPLAVAPDWLLEAARKTEVDPTTIVTAEDLPKPEDLDEATWKRLSAYAQRAIDSELKRLDKLHPEVWAANGSAPWNHTTFEVSCSLLEFANSPWNAYSPGQARRDVLARAPRDPDGFDDYVVDKTFRSAVERVGDKARPMPEDRRNDDADALFSGPDVRGSSGPTEGGGDTASPVVDPFGGPARFFGGDRGKELLARELADGVMEIGPVGFGRDGHFWSYHDGVWRPDNDVVETRCVDLLGNTFRPGHVSAASPVVKRLAKRITGDPIEPLMNFRNGMLDWRTGELMPHDPAIGSTVQLHTEWDPSAECPKFEKFLAGVMHPDYVALAWEMIGYLMMSGNKHQVAFMLYGGGQNGKGTLLRVVQTLLGTENIANESLDQLNGSAFSTINLYGKIANIAGDIDSTYQETTATFKKLTGEDMIAAEHKYGQRFNFENWAVPLFSANEFPGSSDTSGGYLRRWIILHFHKKISEAEKITGFSNMLVSELAGIAGKGVEALRVLDARDGFNPTGEALKGKEEFALAIDQVREWLRDGEVTGGPDIETPLDRLYAQYVIWAGRTHHKAVKESEFSRRLSAIGYESTRVAGNVYHKGISVPAVVGASVTPGNFF